MKPAVPRPVTAAQVPYGRPLRTYLLDAARTATLSALDRASLGVALLRAPRSEVLVPVPRIVGVGAGRLGVRDQPLIGHEQGILGFFRGKVRTLRLLALSLAAALRYPAGRVPPG